MLEVGRLDEAEAQFRKLKIDFPTSTWRTMYGGHVAVLSAMGGDSTAALGLIRSIPKSIEQWPGENTYWNSRVAAELGRKAEAVELLGKAFEEGYPQVNLSHSNWFDFPTLQGYPPFEALVASDR